MSRRIGRVALAGVALAALGALSVGCPGGGPFLKAFPAAFLFANGSMTDTLTLSNGGSGTLRWSVASAPAWLTVAPDQGVLTTGLSSVTLTVAYGGLPAGTTSGALVLASNGGSMTVPVSVVVTEPPNPPVLTVSAQDVSFGDAGSSQTVTVRNTGGGMLSWSVVNGLPWLGVAPGAGTATTETDAVQLTVSRSGLAPGGYSGSISIQSNGGNATINVTMAVGQAVPQLTVSTQTLDIASNLNEGVFSVRNTGTGTLAWSAAVAASPSAPWLSVAPVSGETTTEADAVTVTVDRSHPAMQAGANAGAVAIVSNGGVATVAVNVSALPATLEVTPLQVNFGSFATSKLASIRNGGVGSVTWQINGASLPDWLSISPLQGTAGATPQPALLTANRFPGGVALAPGTYATDVWVTSNAGDALIRVSLSVAVEPLLGVDTGAVTAEDQPLAAFGDSRSSAEMIVSNQGTGTLDWSADPSKLPPWLAIRPSADSLTAGGSTRVTLTVSRTNLASGSYVYQLPISSNGGKATVEVSMVVPLRPAIATDVDNLDLGFDKDSEAFAVFNAGDANTILNFKIVSNKKWLFVYPETGSSRGVTGSVKDVQPISVSVDRSSLDSSGAVGILTVYALDGGGNINMDIAPAEVTVSVQSPSLSFETAEARLRPPSLVRWVAILRDVQDRAITLTPSQIAELERPASGGAPAFRILEKAIPLEQTETNLFLRRGNSVRTHIVLLLDYSGSMFAAAQGLGIPGPDPLQTVYNAAGQAFFEGVLDQLGANAEPGAYEVALMEFHDRGVAASVRQSFTTNKASLLNALQTTHIADHGATELLPAIQAAAGSLVARDGIFMPFDDADVRAVVVVTDGRLTTPPGDVASLITDLKKDKIRVFSVAWGKAINNEVLSRLSHETGGHFYPVLPDSQNNPTQSGMASRLQFRSPTPDEPRPLTIPNDLNAQLVLGYVTLSSESSVPTRFSAQFDDPGDIPDQGVIEGSSEDQSLDFDTVIGQVKLGQLSVRSSGISGGKATVIVRAEYVPRNINKLQFTVDAPAGLVLARVSAATGGIIEDWSQTLVADFGTGGSGVYRFDAPSPDAVLPFGAFGDLVALQFSGLPAAPLLINFAVDNGIYGGDVDPKQFIAPTAFRLLPAAASIGPAFPSAVMTPRVLDFGSAFHTLDFSIENIGGILAPANVVLNWKVGDKPSFVVPRPSEGVIEDTFVPHIVKVSLDRTGPAGLYAGAMTVNWDGGSSGVGGSTVVTVWASVLPPVMSVTPLTLTFEPLVDSQTFSIANTGQSTLTWTVQTGGLPPEISVSPSSGSTTTERDDVTVTVKRTGLSSGTHDYSFGVQGDDGTTQIVEVSVQVP